ncbi:response regulator [Luteolibacter algae]|uniref:Response regulator n=1 Tax=Luteolibacter algae TaxID=454151 RepID=A0ABW5D729_9BACT
MSSENDTYDYQRHAILFVDDEANSRKYFQRLFGRKFRILEAEDGVQALEVFRANADDIGIIVTDQRMPNETGVGFLTKIAADYPDVIKILSTAYADIDAAIGSVNQGGIFRYITKPWDIPELEITLRRAMEFYIVKRERDALMGAKMLAVGNVLLANRLAAFAFVPVCAAIPSANAAEAIASFIRLAISSPDAATESRNDTSTPNLSKLHARQLQLATLLEQKLPSAIKASDCAGRVKNLAEALTSAGANGLTVNEDATEICAETDPTPVLLEAILGNESDPRVSEDAIAVLAAIMGIYDSGFAVTRKRAATLQLTVSPRVERAGSADQTAGSQAAKWLIEDELLVSAALGIL